MTTWGTFGGYVKSPLPIKSEPPEPVLTTPENWFKSSPLILPQPIGPPPPLKQPVDYPLIVDKGIEPPNIRKTGISVMPKTEPPASNPTFSIVDKLKGLKDKVIDFATTPIQDGKKYRVICKPLSADHMKRLQAIKGKGYTFLNTRVEIIEVGKINDDPYFIARFRRV